MIRFADEEIEALQTCLYIADPGDEDPPPLEVRLAYAVLSRIKNYEKFCRSFDNAVPWYPVKYDKD